MSDPVLFEERDAPAGKKVGIATFNAEQTLNSLSLEMIDLLTPQLLAWQADESIAVVALQGAGDRAFCAGGDIQELYRSMVAHPDGPNPYADAFFEREYRLDYLLHTYKKPVLVWGHGFVMGGGLGVYGGCSFRIATEKTKIALPEITIGLFPDAGASLFLDKMPEHYAYFMALTGCQINARDALMVGLADYLVPNDHKEQVLTLLTTQKWTDSARENSELLSRLLHGQEHTAEFPAGQLESHAAAILQMISACSPDTFLQDFEQQIGKLQSDDAWLQRAVSTFKNGCPTTAHIIVRQIRKARGLSTKEAFELELNIALHCTRKGEFTEGVRALLIDKDNEPKWRYPKRHEVPDSWVAEHFEPFWQGGNPLANIDID